MTEETLEKGLSLEEKEMKENNFFRDAAFHYVYKFSPLKKEKSFFQIVGDAFLSFVKLIGNMLKTVCCYIINFKGIEPPSTNDNVELSNVGTIFGNLFEVILNKLGFGKKKKMKVLQINLKRQTPEALKYMIPYLILF